jgi:hypothetical protein
LKRVGPGVCGGGAAGEVLRDRDQPHEEVPGGGGRLARPPWRGRREAVYADTKERRHAKFIERHQICFIFWTAGITS